MREERIQIRCSISDGVLENGHVILNFRDINFQVIIRQK